MSSNPDNAPSRAKWTLSILCGGSERPLSIEAATCSLERGDRYVFRDAAGNWIAEIAAAAVLVKPEKSGAAWKG